MKYRVSVGVLTVVITTEDEKECYLSVTRNGDQYGPASEYLPLPPVAALAEALDVSYVEAHRAWEKREVLPGSKKARN